MERALNVSVLKVGRSKTPGRAAGLATAGSLANIADFYRNYKEIWNRDSQMLKNI